VSEGAAAEESRPLEREPTELQDESGSEASPREDPREAPPELQVTVSSLRCPYCHDKVELAQRCACAECLAAHHLDCWAEHPQCASCGSEEQLVPARGGHARQQRVPWLRKARQQGPAEFELPDPCHAPAAATYLGVTLLELNRLISSGQLSARQAGNEVVFNPEAVRALRPRLGQLRLARERALRRRNQASLFRAALFVLALCGLGLGFAGVNGWIVVALWVPFLLVFAWDRLGL